MQWLWAICGVEQWAKTQVVFPETCVPPVLDELDTEGAPGCSGYGKNKMAASNGGQGELQEQLRSLRCRGCGTRRRRASRFCRRREIRLRVVSIGQLFCNDFVWLGP